PYDYGQRWQARPTETVEPRPDLKARWSTNPSGLARPVRIRDRYRNFRTEGRRYVFLRPRMRIPANPGAREKKEAARLQPGRWPPPRTRSFLISSSGSQSSEALMLPRHTCEVLVR